MPFRCPQCQTVDSLEIGFSIELPPDRNSDEISLQVVMCSVCSFRALAVYEEFCHSSAEAASFTHIGYRVSRDAVDSVLAAIQSCPDPYNPHCSCPAHTSLGQQDVYKEWSGLLELERGRTFSMRLCLKPGEHRSQTGGAELSSIDSAADTGEATS